MTVKEPEKAMGFEEALQKLEEMVERLEAGDASLEEALDLFEEGIRMSKRCAEILDAAQTRVQRLIEDEGGIRLELLDIEGRSETGDGC